MGGERDEEEEDDEDEEEGGESRSESSRSQSTRSRDSDQVHLLPHRPRSRRGELAEEVVAPTFKEVLDVLLREELVALAFLRFVALFCQTGDIESVYQCSWNNLYEQSPQVLRLWSPQ